jgi:UDP-N-acetylmuramoylalanine--D-glutamate ligase
MQLGASVTIVDDAESEALRERAEILGTLGARIMLGHRGACPEADVLVVSPGLRPSDPLIASAVSQGIGVWGELELAWRLRPAKDPAPWLAVTGTNGKTTATLMLASMLRADGRSAAAAGNIGNSLVDVVMHERPEVIALEVGAPQLPFVQSMSPLAAVCLNLAEDHLDHFASMEEYSTTKARVFERTQAAAVYNADDPQTLRMVETADVLDGCRAIGFTLGAPAVSMLGVVDGLIVDRAFIPDRARSAQELAQVSDVLPAAPHNVANALAAAALARAYGVEPESVRDGLRGFTPAPHRIALVGTVDGVDYVDDSKATNTHAAATSLKAYEHVVWIAGGMAKGQDFGPLVAETAARLRAAVLLGVDRDVVAEALRRHAPNVPVLSLDRTDTGCVAEAVRAASQIAQPGDTVLLAPGCASWDMFDNYGHRGDVFAQAVAELIEGAR